FFFSSRRRHTRSDRDWSSDVCSSDLDHTRLILISHQINITGQITPVRAICDLARSKEIEAIVDGAHSFAQFDFKQKDLGCDYFGTSLHKWLYAPKGTGMLYVKRDKIEK